MKRLSLTICFVFTLFVSAAVAQMTPSGAQGTSPSAGQPSQQQPAASQPDTPALAGQAEQSNSSPKAEKGEKLKGCVQSQGGQFVLETKKGKAIALSGQDVSAHVGHEVSLKGTWDTGAAAGASATPTAAGSAGKTFNVTGVDMISESCGKSKEESKGGSTGTAPSGAPASTPATPPQ